MEAQKSEFLQAMKGILADYSVIAQQPQELRYVQRHAAHGHPDDAVLASVLRAFAPFWPCRRKGGIPLENHARNGASAGTSRLLDFEVWLAFFQVELANPPPVFI